MTINTAAYAARPSERFDIGGVIGRTFAVIGNNLSMFILLTVICAFIPAVVSGAISFKFYSELSGASPNFWANWASHGFKSPSGLNPGSVFMVSLLRALGLFYLQAVVAATVISQDQGVASPSILSAPWRHILPLFGILLLTVLAVAVGFVLLVVPGIIVALAFSVAAPVRVGEGRGVFSSFQRSRNLTRSFRWRIFLVFLLLALIGGAVGLVGGLLRAVFHLSLATWTVSVSPFTSAAMQLINAAAAAVLYCELRRVKEGGGAAKLAEAFA
jgi:hypothetical protein